jgi:Cyclic nucleotide-binding domain
VDSNHKQPFVTVALLADRSAEDHNDGNSGSVVMPEARIDLLQRMPVFGGVRADILQFLLGVCPVVSVPANEYFFREHDQADSMFVLEAGKVAVLKSWRGSEYLLGMLKEGDCFGEMAVMEAPPSAPSKIAPQSVFRQRASIRSTSRISSSSR